MKLFQMPNFKNCALKLEYAHNTVHPFTQAISRVATSPYTAGDVILEAVPLK
jgi:hypothetical protein